MTTVLNAETDSPVSTPPAAPPLRVALLGLGNVGTAIATLVRQPTDAAPRFSIVSALVRDVHRKRSTDTAGIALSADSVATLDSTPDVVVEVLGGLEPARSIVKAALTRGLPVVTANKTMLAAHGDELFETAAEHDVPLLYEASVLAGVPFLGTFGRRPLAREATGIAGIVNGTSNFILSRMLTDRVSFADALASAKRAGYAEPDPAKDVDGEDAVEKLCVLLRHFGGWSITPGGIERTGIRSVDVQDLQHAIAFGGRIRPVVAADWSGDSVSAFAGPAFVPASHGLAAVDGVQNAVSIRSRWTGDLFFSGPGAGPAVTAATILDDVIEAEGVGRTHVRRAKKTPGGCPAASTGWFIRLTLAGPTNEADCPSLLAGLGVRMRRTSPIVRHANGRRQWLLTYACTRGHLDAALDILAARHGCEAWTARVLE